MRERDTERQRQIETYGEGETRNKEAVSECETNAKIMLWLLMVVIDQVFIGIVFIYHIITYDCNSHTGICIRRFDGIYAYCRYFIDRRW